MDRFRVAGGARLAGTVSVAGAKNSALKLMASTLLAPVKQLLQIYQRLPMLITWRSY